MRWFQNLPQTSRKLWNERRGPALAAAALLALAALLVLGFIIADSQDEGEHELIKILRTQSETAQRQAEQTSAETPTDAATDAANPQDKTIEEWAELAAKRTLTQDEYYGQIVNEYPATSGTAFSKVAVIIDSEDHYIGPQTAEALMVYVNLHESRRGDYDELKAIFQRLLDRGVVFQDGRDIAYYGVDLLDAIKSARKSSLAKDIFEMYGAPEGNWGELEEAMFEHTLKTAPIRKEQFRHHFQTGEGTVNLELNPNNEAVHMTVVSGANRRKFTDEEIYKMTHYGIAPKGYRLRFVNNIMDKEEIPFDQVPFFNERKYVKHLSRDGLNNLLKAIPSLMSRPEAQDLSDANWMSMAGRYEAALEELASRGYVPEPFANRQPSAPSPSGVIRSAAPPGTTAAPAPPVEQRESTAPPAEARDEAALAEAERKRRVAEAFLNALEKEAKTGKITPEGRSLIAQRLRELRLMQNPDLRKPPTPPSSEDDSEDNE